ncbi:MAG: hypothetical protein PVF43_08365 [Candidatus Eiseniibacteriota bacterium]
MKSLLLTAAMLALACSAFATDSGVEPIPGITGGPISNATGDASLTTLFASNNNFAGNSFDIITTTDVTVVGWDINLDPTTGPANIDVWWRVGTALGNESNPAGWMLLGSDNVTGAGVDLPTHVDVGGLSISAGTTIGVIIICNECVTGVGGFNYTNIPQGTTYSNADMTVTTWNGFGPPFPPSSVFEGRAWNGTVHYDYAGSTPVEAATWGSIKVGYHD